jgi:flagellar basal body-associated protein FliL
MANKKEKNSKKLIIAIVAIIVVLVLVVAVVSVLIKNKRVKKMVPLTVEQQQGVDDFANQIKTYYEQKYQK